MKVAVAGGDAALRVELGLLLRALPDVEVLPGASGDGADVVMVSGDAEAGAIDRCRALSSRHACVLVVDDPADPATLREAMAAGARGIVGRQPGAFDLGRALAAARAFVPSVPSAGAPDGRLVAVTGAAGGCGVTTLVLALAGIVRGPVSILDLDPAGGVVAERLGLPEEATAAGLAGEDSGARAWERLRVAVAGTTVVPAPPRPDLAWLVREGVPAGLASAARDAGHAVLADIGRAVGPALEVPAAADAVLLVTRPDARSLAGAAARVDFLTRLGVARDAVVVCANGCSRAQLVGLGPAARVLGRDVDAAVPHDADLAEGVVTRGTRRHLGALVERLGLERAA